MVEMCIRDRVREQQRSWERMTVAEHLEYYTSQGMDRKAAMKQVAKDRGVGKREVYQQLLVSDKSVSYTHLEKDRAVTCPILFCLDSGKM